MRILQFYRTSFPDTMGGIEQTIHQIARGAVKLGIRMDVLSLTAAGGARTIEMDGYRVHRVRRDWQIASTGFSVSAFARFAHLAERADVLHFHYPWPFMDAVYFTTRIRKPTLVTYHSDIIRQKRLLKIYRPLQHKFLARMDRIVATSMNYFSSSPILAKFSSKVAVIPIGLDKSSYPEPTAERMHSWRHKLGSRFFLFVGMIRYYKGLHILLEALQGTDYPAVIVGTGPMERELKRLAVRLGLRHVHFTGHLPDSDKVALLTLCRAVVFPSHLRSEAFGVSLLEGAMFAKPMISTDIDTGTSFINISGETGWVVPPGDAVALRQAMGHLWENPGEAAAMGRRAEVRFWEHFTADRMMSSYAALYRDLAASVSPGS